MRTTTTTLLVVPFLLAGLSSAITGIDCKQDIVVNKKRFDFSKLDFPHSVMVEDKDRPPAILNTTWTVNICRPLVKDKDIADDDQCPQGTNICGIVKSWNPKEDPDKEHIQTVSAIPIAGTWGQDSGHTMHPKWSRLEEDDSSAEGIQLEVQGRKYNKLTQSAVIQFQCDKSKAKEDSSANDKRADKDDEDDSSSLSFVSYSPVDTDKGIVEVLRLNWKTKYACEDYINEVHDKNAGWGFFTWFILIAFMGIASYLIFGSWLNYNRYGARGWDLLPHGDTIRDVPYLFKDWSRKVVDTVSGGGSRGGYSAV